VSPPDSPADALAAIVAAMPAAFVRALASTASAHAAWSEEAAAGCLGAVPNPTYRHDAALLLRHWEATPGCSGQAFALVLESVLRMREIERDAEIVEVVATGPTTPHVSLRHTKAVFLDLVADAHQELFIVSYAAYRVPEIVTALEAASARGVTVRLILETTIDSAAALTHDAADAFRSLADRVELYVWPAERRPAGSKLHAKALIADGRVAFVTSANLTGHAMDQNLELGILVRGGQAPRRLADHFRALIGRVLVRMG
jgi:phosphatidylserine/phosphatidylglycerophosphate/cardiolipin synthase-like enzyme